jgi:esterase/lipase superfamily enzyme
MDQIAAAMHMRLLRRGQLVLKLRIVSPAARHLIVAAGLVWVVGLLGLLGPMGVLHAQPLEVDSPHMAQHRELTRRFQALIKRDPPGALRFAQNEVEASRRYLPDDPRRADALELLASAYSAAQDWRRALPAADAVVRARKAAEPQEPELLALALGAQGLVLFGLERAADADASFGEELEVWRQVYRPPDLRLADKLERHAKHVQSGFARRTWVIELLLEALAIRRGHPPTAGLAGLLQELSIHELRQQQVGRADAHLVEAQAVLADLVRQRPDDQELRASTAQGLVLRAGIAVATGQIQVAKAQLQKARQLRFTDRALQVEVAVLIAQPRSRIFRQEDRLQDAINAQFEALDLLQRNQDLVDRGALDDLLTADVLTELGRLYLDTGELALSRQALQGARQRLGDVPEMLFLQSELEQRSGRPDEAMKLYQQALKLRKESAAEAMVLFGTTRRPAKTAKGEVPGRFAGAGSDELRFGAAHVLVPGAQFSSKASLLSTRLETRPFGQATDANQLLIRKRQVLSEKAFAAEVAQELALATLNADAALVFVHGFNVSFDEALQRAAQLKRDLNFDGPLFVFSWPSRGEFWRYGSDRTSANDSAMSLLNFLQRVAAATGHAKLHVLAHSMGNRVLLPALAHPRAATFADRIGQVVLAAPAVPNESFRQWIDLAAGRGIDRFTLYASRSDKAMWAGFLRESSTLAGYSPHGQPLLHAKVQSIDLSTAGMPGVTELNHDVFTANPVMSEDIRQLLQFGQQRMPHQRSALLHCRQLSNDRLHFWVYSAVGAEDKTAPGCGVK